MSKKMKIILIVIALIVVLAAAVAAVITIAERNHRKVDEIVIEDVDLSGLADGIYTGDYNAFPVVVKVEVTVQDRAMTTVRLLKHMNGRGGAADVLPEKVVQAQTLLVDTISGATYSSKVILLAIHDALTNGTAE